MPNPDSRAIPVPARVEKAVSPRDRPAFFRGPSSVINAHPSLQEHGGPDPDEEAKTHKGHDSVHEQQQPGGDGYHER
jgi:hypothetical protein